MKTLFVYRSEQEREYVQESLRGHEVVFVPGPLSEHTWDGTGIECVSVFVTSPIGEAELAKLPDLKLIATRSTGYDHIAVPLARSRGIVVTNVPSYGEHTVSEFAFALLLALTRNMIKANEQVVEDGSFSAEGLTGFDLNGKTLGVLGTGRIGKNMLRIGRGFGMRLVAFDAYPDAQFAAEVGVTYASLTEVLAQADVLSLHLPELPETHHIINKDAVSAMKRGAILINTARGALIDTEALVWGLKEGIIAAAGLDVLDEEGYVADEMRLLGDAHPKAESLKTLLFNHYLIDHPNVIITPHMAFNTREALQRILDTTIDTIDAFARGEIKNAVS
jgi:D-lactate dehydrogenase